MTYHYKGYWANITPVRDPVTRRAIYWEFQIYKSGSDTLLHDGRNAKAGAARIMAETIVDSLVAKSQTLAA